MKHRKNGAPHLTALAIALLCAVTGPALSVAAANENKTAHRQSFAVPAFDPAAASAEEPAASASGFVKNGIDDTRERRIRSVESFATTAHSLMVNNITSRQYAANEHFLASSTFPLRLFRNMGSNPWMPAPFMPVPEKDLACYYGIPPYKTPEDYDSSTAPVNITSDLISGDVDSRVDYKGNVNVRQGDMTLKSDTLTLDRKNGLLTAKGNVLYQSPLVTVSSRGTLTRNLNTEVNEITEPNIQMNGSVASGNASKITMVKDPDGVILENMSFTTCPAGDTSWHIESDSVELYKDAYFGESYGNVVYIGSVPVFYLPYANFPITNRSKSGLLYPYLSVSSENGFDYAQPVYWSIASNYDFTLTPRYMSKRGLMLGSEFRYMPLPSTSGSISFDYMPDDRAWALESIHSDAKRYLFSWQHVSGFFDNDLVLNLDYKHVRNNDYDYINDIGIPGAQITDDHLRQSLSLAYDRPTYNLNVELRDYQRMLPDSALLNRPFALMPQISADYTDTFDTYTFDIHGELSRFTGSSDSDFSNFSATRLHFEPAVSKQIFNTRGTSLSAEIRGFFTSYGQDSLDQLPDGYINQSGFTSLAENKSRALYMLQLNGKTSFERKVWDLRHTQTLEPEIQYQYIPYKNQDDIALYDTTDRMTDYYSQFSFRTFTGPDRIADLNRLTMGLTSRVLDAHDREIMRVGVAQAFSFVQTRVTLTPDEPADNYPRTPVSVFFNARPMQNLLTHASMSYNNENDTISSWNAMTEYQNEDGLLLQVSYRFADSGNSTIDNRPIDLNQLGVVASLPFSNRLKLTLAGYHDLEQGYNIDSKIALKWEDCCWSLALVYERYNKTDWESYDRETDHRIGLAFEFKGLGAVNITGSSSSDKDTDTHLLDYFNPTNLNR